MLELINMVKILDNINQVHNTLSADRCYFNVKNKKDNKCYEFVLKKNMFNNSNSNIDKSIYELLVYNNPTNKWIKLYDTNSIEEIIEYIGKI